MTNSALSSVLIPCRLIFRSVAAAVLLLGSSFVFGQDDAFLACARFTDRVERVFCLEKALEDATGQQETVDNTNPAEGAVPDTGTAPVAETSRVPQQAPPVREANPPPQRAQPARETPRQPQQAQPQTVKNEAPPADKVENFGRESQAKVVQGEDGMEELHDEIAALKHYKPNMWELTLASGQVWRQIHPKRLNLREGDQVRIYQTHWGKNYRLETARLSGFIQILRVE